MEEFKVFKTLNKVQLLVSTEGRVKSRNIFNGIERDIKLYPRGGRRKQYLAFGYKENKKKILVQIHRAVALCFIENPNDLPQVNHKDLNTLNNKFSNLEWISNLDNTRHYYENR